MTREDSIRTRTWVTEDGRYLTVDQIAPDHLLRIEEMLRSQLPPGYDTTAGRQIASDFVAEQENQLDYTIEMDRDAFSSAWLQIIEDEFVRRAV